MAKTNSNQNNNNQNSNSSNAGSMIGGISNALGGVSTLVSNGFNNINSVNGDLQYDALDAMHNRDYGIGDTAALLEAYNSRPIAQTNYGFSDVGGKTWGEVALGSFADSVTGFTAGSAFGPWGMAIGAILGGVEGLATGAAGRIKADKLAADLNEQGNIANVQDVMKLANAASNSRAIQNEVAYAADGGLLRTHGTDWSNGLTYFNTGGSHESNPYGGILLGISQDGTQNYGEQGEVRYKDYMYSTRNKLGKKYQKDNYIDDKYIGETFADVAKALAKDSEERPNDPIEKRTLEDNMGRLASAQESYREDKARRAVRKQLMNSLEGLNSDELAYLQQALQMNEEGVPQDEEADIIGAEQALQMQDNQQRQFDGGGWIDFLEAAPVFGSAYQVLSDAAGWTNKNDYSAYLPAKQALGSVRTVSASPIGGYVGYTPQSTDYIANAMRNQYANNVRNIANLSGNNRGTALAGILSNGNNFRSSLGDLYMDAARQNFENRMKVAEFNTGIREKEIANSLAAQQANQSRDLALAKDWLNYANAIQGIRDANDEAIGANISALATNLGNLGKTYRARRQRDKAIETYGRPGSNIFSED